MRLVLTSVDLARVREHAQACWPQECCGVLLGRVIGEERIVCVVMPSANIAEGERTRHYQIDWNVLLAACRRAREEGLAVLGFYHSHPDGSAAPSVVDGQSAIEEHVYVILPIFAGAPGQARAWVYRDGRPSACPIVEGGAPEAGS